MVHALVRSLLCGTGHQSCCWEPAHAMQVSTCGHWAVLHLKWRAVVHCFKEIRKLEQCSRSFTFWALLLKVFGLESHSFLFSCNAAPCGSQASQPCATSLQISPEDLWTWCGALCATCHKRDHLHGNCLGTQCFGISDLSSKLLPDLSLIANQNMRLLPFFSHATSAISVSL